VRTEQFTGSVAEGGSVNFRDIHFNPHGHGTHTESVGHINQEVTSVNAALKQYFFLAKLITIEPKTLTSSESEFRQVGDRIITKKQIEISLQNIEAEALILRTLPNSEAKKSMQYSGTNPAYLEPACLRLIRAKGIKHLLLDLPSVDREIDGGKLDAHREFWFSDHEENEECTITEMVYVEDKIDDGSYLLNLQTAPFENDATPSRPVLFKLTS